MGTRSLTVVLDEEGREIFTLYRQFDGYPTVHGAELKEFLDGLQVVNGYSSNDQRKIANGMSCLAAQIIARFKNGVGGFYLHPPGTRDCGEEYVYTVYLRPASKRRPACLYLRIQAGAVTFFGLPGTKQKNMPTIYDGTISGFDPAEVQKLWNEWPEEPVNDFIDEQVLSTEILDVPDVPLPKK